MSDATRRGPRMDMGTEDHDSFDISGGGPQQPDYSQATKPSAVPMVSLLISMVALGLAVWALAAPPASPLLTTPSPPGMTQAPAGDRVARLEQDIQKALLHLVTMERRIKKLEGKVELLAENQAQIAARSTFQPTAEPTEEATAAPAKPEPTSQAAKPKPAPKGPQKQIYKVRSGDNLYEIARQHKVTISELRKWNNLKKSSVIKVGQRLIIYK